ncbi:hypothetical protein [Clostridium sp. JN-9]|uniref:hypothetical protein n=1 Tax=Clostridium sp. JN-9 TaxID=2507159 RepID=UPI000FFDFDF0|nr:hypothetical protein [Clostridium sp. JN-9]QAT40854.1 hypothetical protein EQM05_11590 [Clostridium sp. JN-9]
MIKVVIGILLFIIALITCSLCIVAKRGDQYSEECKYNALAGCKGKCCRNCELENICKLACKDDPEQCGGRLNY